MGSDLVTNLALDKKVNFELSLLLLTWLWIETLGFFECIVRHAHLPLFRGAIGFKVGSDLVTNLALDKKVNFELSLLLLTWLWIEM